MVILLVILFILGTFFGSFASVLIERWRHGKSGIVSGRSECPKCGHVLGAIELIPILSWLIQKGKCRSCHTKVSIFYPICEILMGFIFMIVGMIGIYSNTSPHLVSMSIFILFILGFTTGVYMLYDAKYMEIPDQIMIPILYLLIFMHIGVYMFPSIELWFFDRTGYINRDALLFDHFIAGWGLYTFFFLQILIPGVYFFLKKRLYKDALGLLISYVTFPIELLISPFMKKNDEEDESMNFPTWIGGGDLRIAFMIGLTLGSIHTLAAVMVAYIVGSVVGIILRISKGSKQIPFGPFLGIGWLFAVLFYFQILDFLSF